MLQPARSEPIVRMRAPTCRFGRSRATACAGRSCCWSQPGSACCPRRSPGSSRSRSAALSSTGDPCVILNCSYWYVWALFTPVIVWLSQHFRFERRGLWRALLVHLPSVALFSFAHIAAMSGVQLWLATIAGRAVRVVARRPAIGAPELRLGDDHLLGHRRPEPRRPLLPRVARPRAAHVAARDASWSRRSWRRCSSSSTRTSCSTRCTRSPR